MNRRSSDHLSSAGPIQGYYAPVVYSLLALCLVSVLAGCSEVRGEPPAVVLRVSAGHALAPFHPRHRTGSTAYALELVYLPGYSHATMHSRTGTTVVLRRLAESRYNAAFICKQMHVCGASSQTLRGEDCIIEFPSPGEAEEFEGQFAVGFSGNLDTGLFEVAEQRGTDGRLIPTAPLCAPPATDSQAVQNVSRVVLSARGRSDIDRLEIISMPVYDEWRRLFAGEIDVIPSAIQHHRALFEEMQTVEIIGIPDRYVIVLFFNTRRQAWAQADVRRTLAGALDREAIARVVCRAPDCASDSWTSREPESARAIPQQISILVVSNDTPQVITAQAVRYQLRKAFPGIAIQVIEQPLQEMRRTIDAGEYDLVIMPCGRTDQLQRRLLKDTFKYRLEAVAGYESSELNEAVDSEDIAALRDILARDVPLFPLYKMRQFAVVDRRFCGGDPVSASSWTWLAGLRPQPCPEQ